VVGLKIRFSVYGSLLQIGCQNGFSERGWLSIRLTPASQGHYFGLKNLRWVPKLTDAAHDGY
jgi:hypothetical protein